MPNTITLKVANNATIEHLTEVLAKIGHETGCRACGLLGYKITFEGDPDPGLSKFTAGLNGLPGIQVASFE